MSSSSQRTTVLYVAIACFGTLAILGILHFGMELYPSTEGEQLSYPKGHESLPRLLMALGIIIASAKLCAHLFKWLKQPPVMGEVIAGIALGPSLLGEFFPTAQAFLFPSEILPILSTLAQIGVILFMFVVGIEFDVRLLKRKGKASIIISHASMFFPFLLGCMFAAYAFPHYAPPHVSFLNFSLFIGVSLSVTAFPVLARILKDLGLSNHPRAALTLACAAIDDVSAWCLLALISSIATAQPGKIAWTVFLTFLFIFGMIFLLMPYAKKLSERVDEGKLGFEPFTIVILLLLLAAWSTAMIGIHALFGAFLLGVLVPSGSRLAEQLNERLERLTTTLFLPVFFAFTGLRTQLDLLLDARVWLITMVVLFLAVLGKIGGTTVAARLMGIRWRDSLAMGSLMNTRGLVELIVLNLGLDLGLLTPTLFSVFVVMAISTSLMTGPLFHVITRKAPWIPAP